MLTLPTPPYGLQKSLEKYMTYMHIYINTHTHCIQWSKHGFCVHSAEIDQKLQEIMKQTGYLKIDGQVRHTIDFTSSNVNLLPQDPQYSGKLPTCTV